MEGKLAGVVGDNAAGIDNESLHLGALPLLPPPGDVVANRVLLGDVRLTPTDGAPVPGERQIIGEPWPSATGSPTVTAARADWMKARRVFFMRVSRVLFKPTTADENRPAIVPLAKGNCEEIRKIWKARREGTPPPMIRKEFRASLEAMKH